jgi:hypothetical protein
MQGEKVYWWLPHGAKIGKFKGKVLVGGLANINI